MRADLLILITYIRSLLELVFLSLKISHPAM